MKRPRSTRTRSILLPIIGLCWFLVPLARSASADWYVEDDPGSATALSVSMSAGPAASASAINDDITVSWPAVALPDGSAVDGYLVTRYSSSDAPVAPGGSCSGIQATLSCVELDVAAGTWTYAVQPIQGSWTGAEGVRSNAVATLAPDLTPPTVTLGALIKATGGDGNVIRQGGTYYAYANANDVGSPQSGVAAVTANVTTITTGSTSVPMVSGSYTVNGVAYGYRSALLTASTPLTAGSRSISFNATDQAGNSAVSNAVAVTVDNTAPSVIDVQTVNGGVLGKADTGDKIIYTYSEPVDAQSILAGWNGSATTVTVRIVQNTSVGDRLQIRNPGNTANTKIGVIRLSSLNYVTATVSFTNSTMVRTGSTITVTLGTPSGATGTVTTAGAMRWTPVVGPLDWAGNALPTTFLTEPGASDIDL